MPSRTLKSKFRLGDRVEVEWVDTIAIINPIWNRLLSFKWEELERGMIHMSLGYFVKETDKYFALCLSKGKSNYLNISLTKIIPKTSILKIIKVDN